MRNQESDRLFCCEIRRRTVRSDGQFRTASDRARPYTLVPFADSNLFSVSVCSFSSRCLSQKKATEAPTTDRIETNQYFDVAFTHSGRRDNPAIARSK